MMNFIAGTARLVVGSLCLLLLTVCINVDNAIAQSAGSFTNDSVVEGSFSVPPDKAPNTTPSKLKPVDVRINPSANAFNRNSGRIKSAVKPIVRKYASSVVEISCDNEVCALGTVVSRNGLVVTKKSLLGKNGVTCHYDDQSWHAQVIAVDQQKDLALLRLHLDKRRETPLTPVAFPSQDYIPPGKIVVGIGSQEQPISFGLTTVESQNIQVAGDECEDCIDMGLTLAPFAQPISIAQQTPAAPGITGSLDELQNSILNNLQGLKVLRVYPRTVSERLGILVGDNIQSLNSVQLMHRMDFNAITSNIKADQPITVVLYRDGERVVIIDKVPRIAKKIKQDRWGGGPFSQRRFGFGRVIVHDSVFQPEDCGSPLINLKGQFVGLNIARSMRVASMSIPSGQILAFVRQHVPFAALKYAEE